MRLIRLFIMLFLTSFLLIGCSAHSNKVNNPKDNAPTIKAKSFQTDAVLQLDITSTFDETVELLRKNINTPIVPISNDDRITIVLDEMKIFDFLTEASFSFKEKITFSELFSIYDVYEEEYKNIREFFYKEKYNIDSLENFYKLSMNEQDEMDHYLVEYIEQDTTWNKLQKKYTQIQKKFSEDVFHYEKPLYMNAEIIIKDELNEKKQNELFQSLNQLFSNETKVLDTFVYQVWLTEKSKVIVDCTRDGREKNTKKCMIHVVPNVHYMNDFLNLNIHF